MRFRRRSKSCSERLISKKPAKRPLNRSGIQGKRKQAEKRDKRAETKSGKERGAGKEASRGER